MKKLVLIAALLAACHTETIPSAELQKRLAEEDEFHTGIPLGIVYVPRTPKDLPGYWHFEYGGAAQVSVDVYVTEGSTFEQIKGVFLAKAKAKYITPPPTTTPN